MQLSKKGLSKNLGPGIILAAAAIGGSHLMFATEAGARFGFSLIGLILLTNLFKYPFLLVGTRFTAATGKSLLEGFKERNTLYLPIYLIVSIITGTITISAVSLVSGALLKNVLLFKNFPEIDLSIAVLVLSGLILIWGQYKALENISKTLVTLLTFLTLFAVISLISNGSINNAVDISSVKLEQSPLALNNLSFLIPLMGWMPCPVELCVWPSLWMFSRNKEANYIPKIKEAEFDFNLGYLITVITAICFLSLGAITMFGSGEGMFNEEISFGQNLINLYTISLGDWAKWVIIPAAFIAMFSTTLTCLDAYPRSISAIQGLISGSDKGRMVTIIEKSRFQKWMIIHIIASLILLITANSGGITLQPFLFAATTASFLAAPIFAWMAMDTMNSNLIKSRYKFSGFLNFLSWIGFSFLTIFSFLYLANKFFGLGT